MKFRERTIRQRDRLCMMHKPIDPPNRRSLFIKKPDGSYVEILPTPVITEPGSPSADQKNQQSTPTRQYLVQGVSYKYPRSLLERGDISFVVGGETFRGELSGQEKECKLLGGIRDRFIAWEFDLQWNLIGKNNNFNQLV